MLSITEAEAELEAGVQSGNLSEVSAAITALQADEAALHRPKPVVRAGAPLHAVHPVPAKPGLTAAQTAALQKQLAHLDTISNAYSQIEQILQQHEALDPALIRRLLTGAKSRQAQVSGEMAKLRALLGVRASYQA